MKVGIVSIFDNENYGNRLQNYALQQVLLNYADDVVTIKNKLDEPNIARRVLRSSPLADSPGINRLCGKRRKSSFLTFNKKHIRLSRRCYFLHGNYSGRMEACDLYCAGSDQVWNPDCGRVGPFNYLGFADREGTFSYAASFGVEAIPEQYREEVRSGIRHIKHLSVREDAGKRIVEELTGRTDVQVLVDPTMLLSREDWDQVALAPGTPVPEKYVLTHFLGDVSPERRSAVQQKADALGCELIELMDPDGPFYHVGPAELIWLIGHARLICTDSFHASVFSFLYRRPFAVFAREGEENNMGSRLQTFTSKFHLDGCIAQGDQMPDVPEEPDYTAGYNALETERKKAKAFLDTVFREAGSIGL